MKYYCSLAFLVAITVSGLSYWQLAPADQAEAGSVATCELAAAERPHVQGIGYVEPASEIRKLMLRTGGVIRRCYVKAGDRLRKGDMVLELEGATQQTEVEVARRQLDLAQAEAEHGASGINPYQLKVVEQAVERLREKARYFGTEAHRSRNLITSRAVSAQEFETIESQLKQTQAELREKEAELEHLRKYVTPESRAMLQAKVRHAEAGVKLAEERLRETILVAPFDGVVLKVLKLEGEGVRMFEPEPVVLYGDLSRRHVRVEVDERFAQHLSAGQDALIYGRSLGEKTYRGRVICLEPIMGAKTVFTSASSERKDLDVLQAVIEMEPAFEAPAGLRVDVRVNYR